MPWGHKLQYLWYLALKVDHKQGCKPQRIWFWYLKKNIFKVLSIYQLHQLLLNWTGNEDAEHYKMATAESLPLWSVFQSTTSPHESVVGFLFCKGDKALKHVAQGHCRVPTTGDPKRVSWHSTGQLTQAGPAWAGGLGPEDLWGSFQGALIWDPLFTVRSGSYFL